MSRMKTRRCCSLHFYLVLMVIYITAGMVLYPVILNADTKEQCGIENSTSVFLTRIEQDMEKYHGTFRIYHLLRDQWVYAGKLFYNPPSYGVYPHFDYLAGSRKLREDITNNVSVEEIIGKWKDEITSFIKIREKNLLYEGAI